MAYYYDETEYLAHFGVKGMKWGVRRSNRSSSSGSAASSSRKKRQPITKTVAKKAKKSSKFVKDFKDELYLRGAQRGNEKYGFVGNEIVSSFKDSGRKRAQQQMARNVIASKTKNHPLAQFGATAAANILINADAQNRRAARAKTRGGAY